MEEEAKKEEGRGEGGEGRGGKGEEGEGSAGRRKRRERHLEKEEKVVASAEDKALRNRNPETKTIPDLAAAA